MPRYAKGTLEHKLYSDIQREAKGETRRNSRVSRAHRLELGMEAVRPTAEPGRFDKTAEMLFLLAFVVENNTDPQVLRTVAEELRLIGRGLEWV